MSSPSRELYFQLGMRADDDGFIQPKSVMKLTGASSDDLKVLIAKRFILPFETGVVVVKHWLVHNMIRADRYKETRFQEEKKRLYIKENKAYTDNEDNGVPLLATKWQPNGNHPAPQVRLGKDRLLNAEYRIEIEESKQKKVTPEMRAVFNLFRHNPARFTWAARVAERNAAKVLHETFGIDELERRYKLTQKYRKEPLCPQIDTPTDLLDKMPKMETFLKNI